MHDRYFDLFMYQNLSYYNLARSVLFCRRHPFVDIYHGWSYSDLARLFLFCRRGSVVQRRLTVKLRLLFLE